MLGRACAVGLGISFSRVILARDLILPRDFGSGSHSPGRFWLWISFSRVILARNLILPRDFGSKSHSPARFWRAGAEFEYELCPFDKVTQKGRGGGGATDLGKWEGFSADTAAAEGVSENKYDTMMFTRGTACWNGPVRSTRVTVRCGAESEVLSVEEPEVRRDAAEMPPRCRRDTTRDQTRALQLPMMWHTCMGASSLNRDPNARHRRCASTRWSSPRRPRAPMRRRRRRERSSRHLKPYRMGSGCDVGAARRIAARVAGRIAAL